MSDKLPSPRWGTPPPRADDFTRPARPGSASDVRLWPPATVAGPAAARNLPTWAVLLTLLLPPLGVVLVWTASTWPRALRVAATALAVALTAGLGVQGAEALRQGGTVADAAAPGATTWSADDVDPQPALTPAPSATPDTALTALAGLRLAAEDRRTRYERDAFGSPWTDTDRNGCDTRNDILARDLVDVVVEPGTQGCVVLRGRLVDPYSGQTLVFERGRSDIEIDHVVALAEAWRSGASNWPYARRLAFANDPLELVAVDGALNQDKSDADAAGWLPAVGRCVLAARQIAIKVEYGLSVDPAEREALAATLSSCPGAALPTGGQPTLAPNRSPPPTR